MKPIGPIPPYFAADSDGMLTIGGRRADDLVEQAGDTPLFVYDIDIVRQRTRRLRAAMPGELALHFAIKANPWAPVLAAMAPLVDGFDVASQGEMERALAAGVAAEAISFAGPGKRNRELEAAIAAGITLNAESKGEVSRSLAIGRALGIAPRIAIRVNPSFDLKGSGMKMGGGAKPFGIDAAQVPAQVDAVREGGGDWRGFHIFAGSQSLDADAIIEAQAQTIALAAELSEAVGAAPAHVNIGGGLGIPYFAGDVALDIESIGASLAKQLNNLPKVLKDTRFAMELGRWFVAEVGVYLTRIVDRKTSHDQTFLVCDGGLHHQLAASGNFGTVIRRNYPIAVANRFLGEADETVSVVGPLCTPLDRLGDQVALPHAEPGDLIAVFLAGAYGRTASPSAFLGHPEPLEMLVNP
jgi:diaminopimelate decarboxylase